MAFTSGWLRLGTQNHWSCLGSGASTGRRLWGLDRPLHTALARSMRPSAYAARLEEHGAPVAPISTRVTSRGTVARLEGCAKKHAVPQRCREAFAPHLERHHRMPCRRERDNRRQAKAGWLQCSLALCSLQHLRWYLVPPVVLKKSSEPTWCSESHCTAVAWCCPAPLPASCPANCPRPAPSGQRG